jgi:alkenylglycerophosphocholine/alkenylglycerophosphoethanolamine hydrolase
MLMNDYPLILVAALAVIDWVAADRKIKPLEYFAKPATMLALLGWLWLNAGFGGSMLWFTLGVIFCLLGDVFLMIPRDLFIFGLGAFLVGHICYIVGLNNSPPFINYWGGLVILELGIYIYWLYPRLARGLKLKGQNQLRIPVLVYALVISLMVYSALMTLTRPGWSIAAAISASVGALLFYASDSMLAWDRFLKPLTHARLRVMVTYHLGQAGILLGAIFYALGK